MLVTKELVSFYTSDATRLDSDLYRPEGEGPWPVLLMRQPYGRQIASTVVYAHPQWYASQGYLVVIQDVRGSGSSQGEFTLFEHEIEDGRETVNWAANLPGSNGLVGMYGFSYQGMTQLYAAIGQPTSLKTICPAMLAYDLYEDWAYENGTFCYEISLAWAIQLAALKAKKQGDLDAFNFLFQTSKNITISPKVSEYLQQYAPSNFYHKWREYSQNNDYWQKLSPKTYIDKLNLPMLHIGGAFDAHLRGTVKLYRQMSQQVDYPQSLVIGPWSHLPWGTRVGELDYRSEAISNIDRLQIRWFNRFLKGEDQSFTPISWFDLGNKSWSSFSTWPTKAKETIFYLTSSGLASTRELSPLSQLDPLNDVIVHDPWRAVPSLGGHNSLNAGPFERSKLDCRNDILCYTSKALTEPLSIAGNIVILLQVQAEANNFDLVVILSEVKPNGEIYNFSQAFAHFSRSSSLEIALQPVHKTLAIGDCLRLSISASSFPSIDLYVELLTVKLLYGELKLCNIAEVETT
jgi:uncharacterized protein